MSRDPLDYLFSLEQFGIKFGLDNIAALTSALGHPERSFHSIHIAGTNGKGSVTAMIAAALQAAGHRTGRYTSPHLTDLAERFVIDGEVIDQQEMRSAISRVADAADRLLAAGTLQAPPTFFEVTTAAAFEIFRQAGVTVAVCEVGLGGRLDATNVLTPVATAITSIAFDHQQYLGGTLAAIAFEKAGIIKPGVPMVIGEIAPEARTVIAEVASERGAPLISAHDGVTLTNLQLGARSIDMDLVTGTADYGTVHLSLAGAHQVDNAVVAVRLLEVLPDAGVAVSRDDVRTGLARVRWPGRLEAIALEDGRELLLDAAHNPAGAAALASYLAPMSERRPLVFAAMRDKDIQGMLRALAPAVGEMIMTRASNRRSADPAELVAAAAIAAPGHKVSSVDSLDAALAAAWRISPRIVVAGSIFLLGDLLERLQRP